MFGRSTKKRRILIMFALVAGASLSRSGATQA